MKLTSSSNLGYRLLEDDSDLQFRDQTDIVKFETPDENKANEGIIVISRPVNRTANLFLSLFSLNSEAEAKPQE